MCGICGVIGEADEAMIRQMATTLRHRGPADEEFLVRPGVALGVRRLRIGDRLKRHEGLRENDAAPWVAFDGAIYNRRELTTMLTKRGHRLTTESDTEIVAHLYQEYGPASVQLLRGMFAYALWDERQRRLLLVRDRLGIKPLYYTIIGETLVFASEVKALLRHPAATAALDAVALDPYLTLQYVPGPRTLFRGISKLQPGHYLSVERGVREIRRYWKIVFGDGEIGADLGEAVDEFRLVLNDAVCCHAIGDGPIGVLLSGGLDSSSIVAQASGAAAGRVRTFTIAFDGPGVEGDLHRARLVARHFGSVHHEIVAKPDVEQILTTVAWHLDEPIGDPAAVATYLACREAQQHVPVVLTGDGGDEVLAAHRRYGRLFVANRLQRTIPSALRERILLPVGRRLPVPPRYKTVLQDLLAEENDLERHLAWTAIFDPGLRQQVLSSEFRPASSLTRDLIASHLKNGDGGSSGLATGLMTLDIHTWLVDDVLTKVDKMSMAASVQARAPFLDHRLVEFVASLPGSVRLLMFGTRRLLRAAMAGVLPRQALTRRTEASLVPVDRWLRGRLAGFVRETLLSSTARQRGWLQSQQVERLIDLHQAGRLSYGRQLWTLLALELWAKQFLDGAASS